MTQGSSGGQTATGNAGPGAGPAGGAPSPTNPTNSTPWGSTSTSNQGVGNGPAWSSAPLGAAYADAPTASVPLVSDGPAASAHTTSTPAAGRTGGSHSAAARARGPRRARLQLRHINPWTVLKFSCVLSIALFFVWLIVIGVLFGVLDGAGVINKINDAYTTIQGGNAKAPVTAGVVFGGAAIIGVVNIVLFIALSTVGSVVYNLCADLVGGVEITLSER
jgi:hypothetical protein